MEGLDTKLLAKLKDRVKRELVQKEKETIEYWLEELQKVYQKNHQSLAELKSDLRRFIDRMKNRVETIKTRGV